MLTTTSETNPHKSKGHRRKKFEPRIVAFCCEHSTYYAADTAASSGFSYPINVEIIRVPCVGRVDAIHVLSAFQKGADGVIVAGCMKDQCYYATGSILAETRMTTLEEKLKIIGLGDRLDFLMMGPGMAYRWVETTQAFNEQVKQLGPSPLKQEDLKETPS